MIACAGTYVSPSGSSAIASSEKSTAMLPTFSRKAQIEALELPYKAIIKSFIRQAAEVTR